VRLIDALLDELRDFKRRSVSLSADDFPVDVEVNDQQTVEWASSTFSDGVLINLYRVADESDEAIIASVHGKGGVVVDFDGPWDTLEEAKEAFDPVEEDWTDN